MDMGKQKQPEVVQRIFPSVPKVFPHIQQIERIHVSMDCNGETLVKQTWMSPSCIQVKAMILHVQLSTSRRCPSMTSRSICSGSRRFLTLIEGLPKTSASIVDTVLCPPDRTLPCPSFPWFFVFTKEDLKITKDFRSVPNPRNLSKKTAETPKGYSVHTYLRNFTTTVAKQSRWNATSLQVVAGTCPLNLSTFHFWVACQNESEPKTVTKLSRILGLMEHDRARHANLKLHSSKLVFGPSSRKGSFSPKRPKKNKIL